MRDKFLANIQNQSTVKNYKKAFSKLDFFLVETNQTERQFIEKLNTSEIHVRYNLLQDLYNHICKTVSDSVSRSYFNNLFYYFLMQGVPLDYTQKKLRIKFRRIKSKVFEGLDRERIELIFSNAKNPILTYMKMLVGGGLRETEGLLVTPRMIKFEEYPARVVLPAEITKLSIPRETFLPPNTTKQIKIIIEERHVQANELIYVDEFIQDETLKEFETRFARIRTKAGLDTPDRKPYQQNDITLHSFRAFFITTFTDLGLESFGRALAGHTKYKNVYYRNSPKQRIEMYSRAINLLDF